MSVDKSGDSEKSDGQAPEGGKEGSPPSTERLPALIRVAGDIPAGSDVERSLDQFIAEANEVRVDMDGWSLSDEVSRARSHKKAARRDEKVRQAVLSATEAARMAAQNQARRELAAVERRSAEQVAELEARLAMAEQRMQEAEERARAPGPRRAVREQPVDEASTERIVPAKIRTGRIRTARVWSRRVRLTRRSQVLLVAIAAAGLAVAAVLLLGVDVRGRAAEESPPPAAGSAPTPEGEVAAPRPAPPPEPVVRSMFPDEPTVTPLDEGEATGESGAPGRVRPPARAKKPAKRARNVGLVDASAQ